jgi:pimeloyl-ACP methyl ester carboxylesterase
MRGARGRTPVRREPPVKEEPDHVAFARGLFGDVLPARALSRGRFSVRDQLHDLGRLPQRPRKVFNWRHVVALGKRLFDLFGNRGTFFGRMLNRVYPYPYPFRRVTIRSFDGTRIQGWLGLQPSRRPGVLIVPGLFSSKDDTAQRRRAVRLWRRWNYNVLVIDLRGFGQSEFKPNTPGWKEAEDVLAAARFLYAFNPVHRVGVLADSMGATAALLAAAQEGIWEEEARAVEKGTAVPRPGGAAAPHGRAREEAFGLVATEAEAEARIRPAAVGRRGALPTRVIQAVLAVSPFAESRPAVEYLDQEPPRALWFRYRVHRIFKRLLIQHTRGEHDSFVASMRHSAAYYGVPEEELYARSDLTRVVGHVKAPAVILHAMDDDLVPQVHAENLERMVKDRDNIAVWVLPWGRHVEFEVLDHRWFWRVAGRFFGQWLGR